MVSWANWSRTQKVGVVAGGCGGCGCLLVVLLFVIGLIGAIVAPPPPEDASPTVSVESPAPASTAAPTAAPTATATSQPTAAPTATVAPTTAPTPAPVDPGEDESEDDRDTQLALGVLATLDVGGRAATTGYDRDLFDWRDDTDRNGCDTRNDVLRRDLTDLTLKPGADGCVVLAGTLDSPFSGGTVSFHQQQDNNVDIDHMVALSDAWQTGADQWGETKRVAFANDPLNLLAVEDGLNAQKSDGDAATWLPPNTDYRCEYVARQIAVKDTYDLRVKSAEKDAMSRILTDCGNVPAFTEDVSWPATGDGDVASTPLPAPEPDEAPEPEQPDNGPADDGGDVSYENCTDARAHGAAPLHAGEPGYSTKMDGDGDGIACEN